MLRNWELKNKNIDFTPELADKYHRVILQLLANRDIVTAEEISNFFRFSYEKDLSDPFLISGMDKVLDRIIEARGNSSDGGEKIAIYGDYDADGVTATAVLYEALSSLGFTNLTYYIPDRQLEGYGLNQKAIEYLKQEGVTLIITVDCGITSFSEIEKAKSLGMDVIITDHHHVLENIPGALVVINPNLSNSGFPFRQLAGVGVAFKLAQALYKRLAPDKIDQLKWLLDLVCIGTVADCMPLRGENRVLVRYGLIVLSKTRRIGLKELFKVGAISIDENNVPDTHRVAYQIAPRINAAGRMDHASVSYKLIIEKNQVIARDLALEVEKRNQERQKVTGQIVKEIEILANNIYRDKKFIFASNPHWPVGILGLVAGKIADEFNKPTVVCQAQEEYFVGSLRSVPNVDIMEVLKECQDVLVKFGGHAQAAGVRIEKGNIEKFYELFSQSMEKKVSEEEVVPVLDIDMEIEARDISWELVSEIGQMEPFGEGNPEPVFLMKNMAVEEIRIVGNGSKHLKLALRPQDGSPKIFDAIGFSMGESFSTLKNGDIVDIVFSIREDQWNGNKKIQLRLIDMKKFYE